MKPLTLDQLQDGVKVLVQFARRDNEEGTAPDWHKPEEVVLTVVRRDKAVKIRGQIHPAGEILCVTPKDRNWAEYGPQDYSPTFQEFECEGWRMKILKVHEGTNQTSGGPALLETENLVREMAIVLKGISNRLPEEEVIEELKADKGYGFQSYGLRPPLKDNEIVYLRELLSRPIVQEIIKRGDTR